MDPPRRVVPGGPSGHVRCLRGCHLQNANTFYVVDGEALCHDCAAKAIMRRARVEYRDKHGLMPIWDELAHAALAVMNAGLNPDIVFHGQPRSVRERVAKLFAEKNNRTLSDP